MSSLSQYSVLKAEHSVLSRREDGVPGQITQRGRSCSIYKCKIRNTALTGSCENSRAANKCRKWTVGFIQKQRNKTHENYKHINKTQDCGWCLVRGLNPHSVFILLYWNFHLFFSFLSFPFLSSPFLSFPFLLLFSPLSIYCLPMKPFSVTSPKHTKPEISSGDLGCNQQVVCNHLVRDSETRRTKFICSNCVLKVTLFHFSGLFHCCQNGELHKESNVLGFVPSTPCHVHLPLSVEFSETYVPVETAGVVLLVVFAYVCV